MMRRAADPALSEQHSRQFSATAARTECPNFPQARRKNCNSVNFCGFCEAVTASSGKATQARTLSDARLLGLTVLICVTGIRAWCRCRSRCSRTCCKCRRAHSSSRTCCSRRSHYSRTQRRRAGRRKALQWRADTRPRRATCRCAGRRTPAPWARAPQRPLQTAGSRDKQAEPTPCAAGPRKPSGHELTVRAVVSSSVWVSFAI